VADALSRRYTRVFILRAKIWGFDMIEELFKEDEDF